MTLTSFTTHDFHRKPRLIYYTNNPIPSFSSPYITIRNPETAIRGLSNSMKFAVPSHQTITYYTPPLAQKHFCTHPLFYVAEQARFNIHYFKQECTTCLLAVWKSWQNISKAQSERPTSFHLQPPYISLPLIFIPTQNKILAKRPLSRLVTFRLRRTSGHFQSAVMRTPSNVIQGF